MFRARVAMRPQPQPLHNCKTSPSRTSLRSGDTMGIGGGARPRQAESADQPHQGLPSVSLFFFFLFTHRTPFTRGPVWQQTCRTHDATAREGERLRRTLRWSPLRALNLFNTPFCSLPLEGDMFNSPILAYRTICIVLHSWQYFWNKQCIAFCL